MVSSRPRAERAGLSAVTPAARTAGAEAWPGIQWVLNKGTWSPCPRSEPAPSEKGPRCFGASSLPPRARPGPFPSRLQGAAGTADSAGPAGAALAPAPSAHQQGPPPARPDGAPSVLSAGGGVCGQVGKLRLGGGEAAPVTGRTRGTAAEHLRTHGLSARTPGTLSPAPVQTPIFQRERLSL